MHDSPALETSSTKFAADLDMGFAEATSKAVTLVDNIEKVIIGKRDVVVQAVCALLARGHILIEDVPGVGKTMLAKAIVQSINGDFKRIQFTADLLPSDITGVNIYSQSSEEFTFRKGPLFTNVLLGDEINRATPRTQSSLLEAMEELQTTVDGVRHVLPCPFFVIATQNPIELEGTYPLPFAQMDRFIVRLRIGYLGAKHEREMIEARMTSSPIEDLGPVLNCHQLVALQQVTQQVRIAPELLDYLVAIIQRTRQVENLEFGASPRGTLDLMRYSQAKALVNGRNYVTPDDIKTSAPPVLAHRVIIRKGTRHGVLDLDTIIDELVESVEVPI